MIRIILYVTLGIVTGCAGYHLCLHPLKPIEMFLIAIVMVILVVLLASLIGLIENT